MRHMSSAAWGVGIGLPLAGLRRAARSARPEEAELALGTPTPEALKSRYGLHYLYARGRHHFSVNRFRAAERRVATLAARGDTNREIARRLYITVSTVEQHLTRVYRKLNVAGREDLAVRLHAVTTVAQSV
jgi:DNA-binding CsgD family transcriptional regulator